MSSKHPPLMPHAERRRLIERPIGAVKVWGRTQPWGGVGIRDSIPTAGGRVWKHMPEDEEWCKSKWEDK